ncbi:Eco29kI family restriction endonuclease [Roseateles sp. LKC17W]|uniref:Eco29kI family restriction endonuclease n=1 Tax=Pelomonas margarita TaxID=3299031 RepID=A0ABW7FE21_9BURK
MSNADPYNPLDKINLGKNVAEALLGRKPQPLPALTRFAGAGLYALYYRGPAAPYERLAALNHGDDPQAPIYVGKAVPAGARKGGTGKDGAQTSALYKRLAEHADSLRATPTLDVGDFSCRYLVVDDIWIPLGESLLIAKFSPIWNTTIDGFGNHDPGKGRYNGLRPRWDVLHPGRSWAERCQQRSETAAQIATEVAARLQVTLPNPKPLFYVEQQATDYRVSNLSDET